ncbi:MAG: LCP family protein, partial [Oscillospiraceae bacterium]|nr:LCP family protein [Oscillospiraceae bacterium]
MSNNIKIAFVSFFISFVVLFPTSVFVAINFIDLSHDNAKQAEAKPEFIISKEQDMNMLLTVCRKNPEPADVYIIIKISAHDKLISIANLPSDTTTMVNTKQGSLKELFDWGGIDYVKLAVENLMDITIDRTVKADNYAIESIVDKLGGIEMT